MAQLTWDQLIKCIETGSFGDLSRSPVHEKRYESDLKVILHSFVSLRHAFLVRFFGHRPMVDSETAKFVAMPSKTQKKVAVLTQNEFPFQLSHEISSQICLIDFVSLLKDDDGDEDSKDEGDPDDFLKGEEISSLFSPNEISEMVRAELGEDIVSRNEIAHALLPNENSVKTSGVLRIEVFLRDKRFTAFADERKEERAQRASDNGELIQKLLGQYPPGETPVRMGYDGIILPSGGSALSFVISRFVMISLLASKEMADERGGVTCVGFYAKGKKKKKKKEQRKKKNSRDRTATSGVILRKKQRRGGVPAKIMAPSSNLKASRKKQIVSKTPRPVKSNGNRNRKGSKRTAQTPVAKIGDDGQMNFDLPASEQTIQRHANLQDSPGLVTLFIHPNPGHFRGNTREWIEFVNECLKLSNDEWILKLGTGPLIFQSHAILVASDGKMRSKSAADGFVRELNALSSGLIHTIRIRQSTMPIGHSLQIKMNRYALNSSLSFQSDLKLSRYVSQIGERIQAMTLLFGRKTRLPYAAMACGVVSGAVSRVIGCLYSRYFFKKRKTQKKGKNQLGEKNIKISANQRKFHYWYMSQSPGSKKSNVEKKIVTGENILALLYWFITILLNELNRETGDADKDQCKCVLHLRDDLGSSQFRQYLNKLDIEAYNDDEMSDEKENEILCERKSIVVSFDLNGFGSVLFSEKAIEYFEDIESLFIEKPSHLSPATVLLDLNEIYSLNSASKSVKRGIYSDAIVNLWICELAMFAMNLNVKQLNILLLVNRPLRSEMIEERFERNFETPMEQDDGKESQESQEGLALVNTTTTPINESVSAVVSQNTPEIEPLKEDESVGGLSFKRNVRSAKLAGRLAMFNESASKKRERRLSDTLQSLHSQSETHSVRERMSVFVQRRKGSATLDALKRQGTLDEFVRVTPETGNESTSNVRKKKIASRLAARMIMYSNASNGKTKEKKDDRARTRGPSPGLLKRMALLEKQEENWKSDYFAKGDGNVNTNEIASLKQSKVSEDIASHVSLFTKLDTEGNDLFKSQLKLMKKGEKKELLALQIRRLREKFAQEYSENVADSMAIFTSIEHGGGERDVDAALEIAFSDRVESYENELNALQRRFEERVAWYKDLRADGDEPYEIDESQRDAMIKVMENAIAKQKKRVADKDLFAKATQDMSRESAHMCLRDLGVLIEQDTVIQLNSTDIFAQLTDKKREEMRQIVHWAIQDNPRLMSLQMANCPIAFSEKGDSCVDSEYLDTLIPLIKECKMLTELNLESNPINEKGICKLAEFIASNPARLRVVKLSNLFGDISTQAMNQLCSQLEKNTQLIKFTIDTRLIQHRDRINKVCSRNWKRFAQMRRLQRTLLAQIKSNPGLANPRPIREDESDEEDEDEEEDDLLVDDGEEDGEDDDEGAYDDDDDDETIDPILD